MNRTDAETAIRASLAHIAPEVDVDLIDPDAELRVDLDLDSMDFLNLMIGIKERTGVDIPEEDYPRVTTFAALASYLAATAGV